MPPNVGNSFAIKSVAVHGGHSTVPARIILCGEAGRPLKRAIGVIGNIGVSGESTTINTRQSFAVAHVNPPGNRSTSLVSATVHGVVDTLPTTGRIGGNKNARPENATAISAVTVVKIRKRTVVPWMFTMSGPLKRLGIGQAKMTIICRRMS